MSSENAQSPDPHAAYRADVENAERLAELEALVTHHRQRAYAMHLEAMKRGQVVTDLEAQLRASQVQVDALADELAQRDADDADPGPDTAGQIVANPDGPAH